MHPLVQPVVIKIVDNEIDRNANGNIPQWIVVNVSIYLSEAQLPKDEQNHAGNTENDGAVGGEQHFSFNLFGVIFWRKKDAFFIAYIKNFENQPLICTRKDHIT